ncbi:MAG TPA: hypothetical protein PKX92_11370 [Edaphocola sp.]|nr:hypothetical protein [Edaphocola sp.]
MKLKILIGLFIFLSLSSCSRYYYAPALQNVPLIKEEGDFNFIGSIGTSDEVKMFDFQTAYAITDHIPITFNYMYGKGGDFSTQNAGKVNYFELGSGYTFPFKEGKIRVGAFGGFGLGKQYHVYPDSPTMLTARINQYKYYLQPAIGLHFNAFELILSNEISYLAFTFNPNNTGTEDGLVKIMDNPRSILIEPGVTVRFGWKSVKLQAQIVNCYSLSKTDMPFETSKSSIGVILNLGKGFKAIP